jgi:hypothetical protein
MKLVRSTGSLLGEETPAGCEIPRHLGRGEGLVAVKNEIKSRVLGRQATCPVARLERVAGGTFTVNDGDAPTSQPLRGNGHVRRPGFRSHHARRKIRERVKELASSRPHVDGSSRGTQSAGG